MGDLKFCTFISVKTMKVKCGQREQQTHNLYRNQGSGHLGTGLLERRKQLNRFPRSVKVKQSIVTIMMIPRVYLVPFS